MTKTLKEEMAAYRRAARAGDKNAKEWVDHWNEQDRKSRQTAEMFERACTSGNEDAFYQAVDQLNDSVHGWSLAIAKAAALPKVSPEIQAAFLRVWTESKLLTLRVGTRRQLSEALRVLLPRSICAGPVRLFRGAPASERHRRNYGFSWSEERKAAEEFAEERRVFDSGSVLFETLAPPEAVLHVREHIEEYYAEREYIVDPYRLTRVRVIARYEHQTARGGFLTAKMASHSRHQPWRR
jgi:hypothetical protein